MTAWSGSLVAARVAIRKAARMPPPARADRPPPVALTGPAALTGTAGPAVLRS